MKFSVTYPLVSHPHDPELVTKDALTRFAQAAERSGFAGIGFTDHPAPTHRWLEAGGHDALDPFAALAFVAAVTESIRLVPNVVVLPYRNPFVVAKSVATIDALSGGRFTLAAATGYLKGEYRALGVDFDHRNDLFDEAIDVIKGIWSTDDYTHEGPAFTAVGQTANPKPADIPIWIGGNSRRARRRVAAVGDGWVPFPAPAALARTARTPALESTADLAVVLEDLWCQVEDVGRDPGAIDISFPTGAGGRPSAPEFTVDAHLEGLADLARIGVTWTPVAITGASLEEAIETLERYGETVIAADGSRVAGKAE